MKPSAQIGLIGGLLDLPLIDKDGCYCGIVDDIELAADGDALRVEALLVGPGAYAGRLPGWALRIMQWLGGDRITRVAWSEVKDIAAAVALRKSADDYGLHVSEHRASRVIPKGGAL